MPFVGLFIHCVAAFRWFCLLKICPSLELASDGLKGRVFECALADIHKDDTAYRKFKLMVEEIQGRNCLTNFHGMSLTTDRIRSLVKKWQVWSSGMRSSHGLYVCLCA